MALSHCWGGKTPLQTTKSTFEENQAALHFDGSSKTFNDAVSVTKQLGLRYLWIDSLCIVQDSKEDWESEAAKMCEVYNNATVTIAADSAKDTSEGLFPATKERSRSNQVHEISVVGSEGQPNTICVRERFGDPFYIRNNVHSNTKPKESKLISRGWVLQEELLSPRILHFNNEELTWTCSTYSRCECRIRPGQPFPSTFRRSFATVPKSPEFKDRLFVEWCAIVVAFTRRKLTRQSDRLPAMSGIAARVEKQAGDEYFCGLWFRDIPFQLLWYRDQSGESNALEPVRLESPYAPSWSWASITGPISYYARSPTDGISAYPLSIPIGLWTTGTSPNKYGAVKIGFIKLLARVLPVQFDRHHNTWVPRIPIRDFYHDNLKINLDVPSELPSTWDDESANSYAFILVGTWKPMSISILCMETLCLLVRRMTKPQDIPQVELAARHPSELEWSEEHPDLKVKPEDSFVRVGLVRGPGSQKAWEEAVPYKVVNLM